MKLIMQSSPAFCLFLPLRSKYSPQHPAVVIVLSLENNLLCNYRLHIKFVGRDIKVY